MSFSFALPILWKMASGGSECWVHWAARAIYARGLWTEQETRLSQVYGAMGIALVLTTSLRLLAAFRNTLRGTFPLALLAGWAMGLFEEFGIGGCNA